MLFAGADRLLIFDGANWTQARMGNSSEIHSLCEEGNRIWAGGVNEIGFFEKDSNGEYIYTNVTPRLGEGNYGVISSIFHVGDNIIIVGQRNVIQLSLKTKADPGITDLPNDSRLRAYLVDDVVYVRRGANADSKLYWWKNGACEEAKMASIGEEKQSISPLGRIGDSVIVGAGRNLYARNLETGEVRCFYTDQGELMRAQLNSSTICSGEHVYICTRAGGVFAIGLDGAVEQISKSQGLASDICNAITPSRANGLWVATDEGISFVYRADLANWIPLPSEARSILGDSNNLYVSHVQSAFLLTDGKKIELPELLRAAWARVGGKVYALSMEKLFVADFGGHQFSEVDIGGGLKVASIVGGNGPNPMLYGSAGLSSVARGGFRWDPKTGERAVYEVAGGLPNYVLDGKGRMWVFTGRGEILMIDQDLQRGAIQFSARRRGRLTLHEGQPLALFSDTGFVSVKGDQKVRGSENVANALATENTEGPAWVAGRNEDNLRVGIIGNEGDGLVWKRRNIPGLRRFKNISLIYRSGSDLWIGSETGVIHADTTKLSGPDFTLPEAEIVVRDPTSKTSRVLPAGQRKLQLKNSEQQISVRFKTHVWGLLEPPQFESRLLPAEDEWTLHKYGDPITRSNLPTGDYTLQIRVRHLGEAGPAATFQVHRLLPWYLSYAGITLFAAAGSFFFYAAVKLRTRQITARNRELEQKIVERTQELAKANAAKSEFLAAMSHEIRNPMNGVIGIIKILQEAKLGSREKYYLTTLHRCAEQLRTTVDDVLDFSKIEAGKITLHPDTFDLAECINSTISAIDLTGDRIELASWAGLRPAVTGDQGKFAQILVNYFTNALKYGVPQAATVDVYVLSEGPQHCRVTVAVKNSGPDIPPHEQATLFETFTRGEYAKRGRIGGSGLGLSICKKFAEAMGGTVGVTSANGLTVFQVTVPFEVARVHRKQEEDTAIPRNLHARALAIEDEDYNRLVLGNILAKLGYKVDWACDGKTALQLSRQNGYDLILTDLMLPDTDGGSLTKEILANCEEPKPPIFAVTAYSTREKEEECVAAGMGGFISKPITVEKLEAAIQGWAAKHRTGAKPVVSAYEPSVAVSVQQLSRLGPLEVILPDFIQKIENEWANIDRMLEDRECTPAANAAHKLISATLLVEANVLSDQLRLLESRLRDGALESEIEKVRTICREEMDSVAKSLAAALKRHQRTNEAQSQT
ncbi:MAG: response regulator [Nibricoccus sp.]